MKIEFQLIKNNLPLSEGYSLSFGKIEEYENFYIVIRCKGKIGVGEVTLLEGYGSENANEVRRSVTLFCDCIENSKTFTETLSIVRSRAPFTSSAIACARETYIMGLEKTFLTTFKSYIPLASFCPGDTVESVSRNAENLVEKGYRTLKMKVGRHAPEIEAELIQEVLARIKNDYSLRLDANQGLSYANAIELCGRIERLEGAERIQFLEQPFPSGQWVEHERLVNEVGIPIMLDESVWRFDDVRRSADCGAHYVKLKLCKHLGIAETTNLIFYARKMGLGIVFGNGVQTGIGNHLEAMIYCETGISTAFEGNGFLKLAENHGGFEVVQGLLYVKGINYVEDMLSKGELVYRYIFPDSKCLNV